MTTVEEDNAHRLDVLMFLFHEAQLATVDEIVRHRQVPVKEEQHEAIRDGTERAVLDLAEAGVVNVEGRSVYPSLAARTFHEVLHENPLGS